HEAGRQDADGPRQQVSPDRDQRPGGGTAGRGGVQRGARRRVRHGGAHAFWRRISMTGIVPFPSISRPPTLIPSNSDSTFAQTSSVTTTEPGRPLPAM